MGKSGICKLSTLAILSGDMSNTSLSNCGNMRPHVTANPSSNCSNDVYGDLATETSEGVAHLNRNQIESNLSVPGIQWCQENALCKSFETSAQVP